MKIPKKYLAPVSIFAIGAMLLVYAATQITVTTNTGTVASGSANLLFSVPGNSPPSGCNSSGGSTPVCEYSSQSTTCPTTGYSDNSGTGTGFTINDWNFPSSGGQSQKFLCVQNAGATHQITITWTPPNSGATPTGATCTTNTGPTINTNAEAIVALTCQVPPNPTTNPETVNLGSLTIS